MKRLTRSSDLSRLFIATCLVLLAQGCLLGRGRDHGEIVGLQRGGWKMEVPAEMVFIPGGSFTIGSVDQNKASSVNPPRQVGVSSFMADIYAITNGAYRKAIDLWLEEAGAGQEGKNPMDELGEEPSSVVESSTSSSEEEDSTVYSEEFIMQELYPDMTVWQKDFAHHMADRVVENYFEHVAFENFPVVGIKWKAAIAFAELRTQYLNEYRAERGLPPMPKFRLPTAAEWTYMARGGKEFAKYPWGGPYVRDVAGNLLANFKASRGNYREEYKYDHTSPVDDFSPNDYDLCIGGNVAEWTLDAYNPAAVARMWDLNPVYLDDNEPRKIIKGGSWKDVSHFLRTDVTDYEHEGRARSYIGFRCVMSWIGEEPN